MTVWTPPSQYDYLNGRRFGGWLGGDFTPMRKGGRVRSRLPPRTKSGRFRKRK